MKANLGLIAALILITSCSKRNPNDTSTNNNSGLLGLITVDIDGITTVFDSVPVCSYYTRPAANVNDIIINGYKKNDTTKSSIQLMLNSSDTVLAETYLDTLTNPGKVNFLISYDPPNITSYSLYGDNSGVFRPEINISFIKDSIQGTFNGRLISVVYLNSTVDTVYHVLTNGKFKLNLNHSSGGP